MRSAPSAWGCTCGTTSSTRSSSIPHTGEPVEGEGEGIPVYTHLERTSQPMIRLFSGDLGRVTSEPCPCGRTYRRLPEGIYGRVDDMLIIRGINVYPHLIAEAIAPRPGDRCRVPHRGRAARRARPARARGRVGRRRGRDRRARPGQGRLRRDAQRRGPRAEHASDHRVQVPSRRRPAEGHRARCDRAGGIQSSGARRRQKFPTSSFTRPGEEPGAGTRCWQSWRPGGSEAYAVDCPGHGNASPRDRGRVTLADYPRMSSSSSSRSVGSIRVVLVGNSTGGLGCQLARAGDPRARGPHHVVHGLRPRATGSPSWTPARRSSRPTSTRSPGTATRCRPTTSSGRGGCKTCPPKPRPPTSPAGSPNRCRSFTDKPDLARLLHRTHACRRSRRASSTASRTSASTGTTAQAWDPRLSGNITGFTYAEVPGSHCCFNCHPEELALAVIELTPSTSTAARRTRPSGSGRRAPATRAEPRRFPGSTRACRPAQLPLVRRQWGQVLHTHISDPGAECLMF